MFRRVRADLARRCEVLCIDPRDAGRSDPSPGPYSIDDMASDVAAVMDELAAGPATVLGYSMGGRIALALALARPDLVCALALAATSAHSPPTRRLSRRWLALHVLGPLPLPRILDPQPRAGFLRQRAASAAFDARARLGELDLPVVVLHGRDDHVLAPQLGAELAHGIRGARLVIVQGGHAALLLRERGRLVDEVCRLAGA